MTPDKPPEPQKPQDDQAPCASLYLVQWPYFVHAFSGDDHYAGPLDKAVQWQENRRMTAEGEN